MTIEHINELRKKYQIGMERVEGWLTTYQIDDSQYGSYVIADTKKQAESILDQRGRGENIQSSKMDLADSVMVNYSILSDDQFIEKAHHILHQVTFIAYPALRNKLVSNHFLHADTGLIHNLFHLMDGVYTTPSENLFQLIEHQYQISSIRYKYMLFINQTISLGYFKKVPQLFL